MADLSDFSVVRPGVPEYEGCSILDRGNVFVFPAFDSGSSSTWLEWVFRGSDGSPVDLSEAAESDPPFSIQIRFREAVRGSRTRSATVEGVFHDPGAGKVRTSVPATIGRWAGVYEVSFAILGPEGSPKAVQNAYAMVDRTLFGADQGRLGPPTVQEIQSELVDVAVKNELTGGIEFDALDLALAVCKPLRQWNETPPPVAETDTTSFEHRSYWMKGICASLLRSAANHYRRAQFPVQAGGVLLDDKRKEEPYLRAASLYGQEWEEFLHRKKAAINMRLGVGSIR
jgi:hypothetical protein